MLQTPGASYSLTGTNLNQLTRGNRSSGGGLEPHDSIPSVKILPNEAGQTVVVLLETSASFGLAGERLRHGRTVDDLFNDATR